MMRSFLAVLCLSGCCSAQETLPFKNLPAFAAAAKAALPRKGSDGFHEPSEAARTRFTECIQMLLRNQVEPAGACLAKVHYTFGRISDTDSRRDYLVAVEAPDSHRGLGTYIVDPVYRRNVVIEVPHPLFDAGTLEEALEAFQKDGLRALFLTGTHRCANLGEAAACGGVTEACGSSAPFRLSDAGHSDRNFFTAAHRATLLLEPRPVAISVHGNGSEPVDAELSDGTRVPSPRSALVNRLRDALTSDGVKAGSCNLPSDSPGGFALCGQTNVQGRLSNGSVSCTENAAKASGTFIHIEQRSTLRESPDRLTKAIREVFPIDGPGRLVGNEKK